MTTMRILHKLLPLVLLALGTQQLLASNITYAVGTCRPGLHSYPTISAAVAATPTATTIDVCPGTYNEQVQITQPVTLQGVLIGNSPQIVIAAPSGGLVTNAADDFGGGPVAAQVLVNNAAGPVTISDITVDGAGNACAYGTKVVGIFYQNSSGSVNRVSVRNQNGNTDGIGILAEAGSANTSVTIENSTIHGFDEAGVLAGTDLSTLQVTTAIKGNTIDGTLFADSNNGLILYPGSNNTVTNNVITNTRGGVFEVYSTGTITNNTLTGNLGGMWVTSNTLSVTSNKISGGQSGITLGYSTAANITSNTISNTSTGINFACYADANVNSNTIADEVTGLSYVPSSTTSSNTYFNVATGVSGGC
jgi:parallel beta-helix repeat protein